MDNGANNNTILGLGMPEISISISNMKTAKLCLRLSFPILDKAEEARVNCVFVFHRRM